MENPPPHARPPFEQAFTTWQHLLQQRGLPGECLWLFEENLCFEPDPANPHAFRLGFQTLFTPPPAQAERIAYEEFAESAGRLVFYRIGSSGDRSLCLLVCDEWFEAKTEAEGFSRRDDWHMAFRPGPREELEEVRDKSRWQHRLQRGRPLQDLDFCMSLQTIHEILAHGRALSTYERYALKFLHMWRHLLGQR